MTYTITLPNITRDAASAVEQRLRGRDGIEDVNMNLSSETITVRATLTYSEVLDLIRQAGVAAN
ncbi:hypothetical protein JMUB6875_03130 [Nocardia sp. JMUB6875]|uniref:heavy-metal-associated domain-containing protein n=1 Tax=Nocardia sp. JMUB6875 TaxID=3158170 RepID=UPI0032E720BF